MLTLNPITDFIKITENKTYEFYITAKKWGTYWYIFAAPKGQHPQIPEGRGGMAGQLTKKAAKHTAEVWAGWMK